MMKSVVLLMGLLTFVSCKDIDKNPSGCEYGTANEDGMCVKLSYKGQKILAEVAKSSFIKDYFETKEDTYRNQPVYEPILEKFVADLNGEKPITNLLLLIKKIDKNLEFISFKVAELRKVYDSSYDNSVYNQLSKLETLQSDLEMMKEALEENSNKAILSYDYQFYDNDRKAQYANDYESRISDLKLKADSQELFGSFSAKVEYSRNDGYSFKVSFSHSYVSKYSQQVKDLKTGLERHMLQDPTCQGDQLSVCINEYYDLIEDEAKTFYSTLIK